MDKKSQSVICTTFANGKKHDFRLFKESKIKINPATEVLTDTGYQGLQKLHKRTDLPKNLIGNRVCTSDLVIN